MILIGEQLHEGVGGSPDQARVVGVSLLASCDWAVVPHTWSAVDSVVHPHKRPGLGEIWPICGG